MSLKRLLDKRPGVNLSRNFNSLKLFLNGKLREIKAANRIHQGCVLPQRILVGTHHKTGSVWLHSIFETICNTHSLVYYLGKQEHLPEYFDVFFQSHSWFDLDALDFPFRGVHMIRDPRDVIISGCFYHQVSQEEWLHQPRNDLQGLTYQQKINSYDNLDDQILFEMEHVGAETLNEMLNWDYNQDTFYELRYEDLIGDTELVLFHKVFVHLGFPGQVIPSLLAIAYNKSIFSGEQGLSSHVRSGKIAQWKSYFRPVHKERFLALFGNALIRLGYEEDDHWASFSENPSEGR